jgi:hypothetical protein
MSLIVLDVLEVHAAQPRQVNHMGKGTCFREVSARVAKPAAVSQFQK